MHTKLSIGSKDLASPVNIETTDEILWSDSTGRSVKTGEMMGAVIATKRTLNITWNFITEGEMSKIKAVMPAGYFGPVKYQTTKNEAIQTLIQAYRGNITAVSAGCIGGTHYYSSVKVTIIER